MKRTIAITASSGMGKTDTLVKLAIADGLTSDQTIIIYDGERTLDMIIEHVCRKNDSMGTHASIYCITPESSSDHINRIIDAANKNPAGMALFVDVPGWQIGDTHNADLVKLSDTANIVYFNVQAHRKHGVRQ